MLSRFFKFVRLCLLVFLGLSVSLVLLLRWFNPPTTAFMLLASVDNLVQGNRKTVMQEWVALEKISPQLRLAVIAAEDQKFPKHYGFDLDSIQSAFYSNAQGNRVRGASTISQQVAKNVFLWSGRSYVRKGLEAYFTLLIELFWPKRRILEVYLNVAEFGHSLYGAEAASREFFRKPASGLTAYEASLLAAVLPNPQRFAADRPSAYVLERAQWIRRQMQNLGTNYVRFTAG